MHLSLKNSLGKWYVNSTEAPLISEGLYTYKQPDGTSDYNQPGGAYVYTRPVFWLLSTGDWLDAGFWRDDASWID